MPDQVQHNAAPYNPLHPIHPLHHEPEHEEHRDEEERGDEDEGGDIPGAAVVEGGEVDIGDGEGGHHLHKDDAFEQRGKVGEAQYRYRHDGYQEELLAHDPCEQSHIERPGGDPLEEGAEQEELDDDAAVGTHLDELLYLPGERHFADIEENCHECGGDDGYLDDIEQRVPDGERAARIDIDPDHIDHEDIGEVDERRVDDALLPEEDDPQGDADIAGVAHETGDGEDRPLLGLLEDHPREKERGDEDDDDNDHIVERRAQMLQVELRRGKPPQRHEGLQKVDRYDREPLGIDLFAEYLFGGISQEDETIDENDREECAYHRRNYSIF